ncbi:hypothetical protein LWM68_40960 [Niabella sp. W65]|nr:hypothetical protein [Niabella sp. W65]MCH7368544.1 hypothetical protein [Niabella sp. W65]ULT44133.1 hypothetical protein KRR40_12655 [Niabella sp. I65]
MDESIIIPIKVLEGDALQKLKDFGNKARNSIGSIGPGRPGEITIDVRVRTNNAPMN